MKAAALLALALALPPSPVQDPDEVGLAIGLLPSRDAAVTAALAAGARLALAEAAEGDRAAIRLVIGPRAGAWSTAASTAVELAGRPGVIALIGPPERDIAHAAAQVATRSQTILLSTSPAASVTATGSTWVRAVVPRQSASPRQGWSRAPAFDVDSTDPATRSFVAAFRRREGRDPDAWAAAGHDAARLVIEAVERRRREDPSGALERSEVIRGPTGILRVDASGRRVPALESTDSGPDSEHEPDPGVTGR